MKLAPLIPSIEYLLAQVTAKDETTLRHVNRLKNYLREQDKGGVLSSRKVSHIGRDYGTKGERMLNGLNNATKGML